MKSFRMPSIGAANICTASLSMAQPTEYRIRAALASGKMPEGCRFPVSVCIAASAFQALNELQSLEIDLDAAAFESKDENVQKLLKGVEDLHTYVERNQEFVPNYGERYRNGEKIASGFVESAINQVVSKRMVKKQQMG